MKPLSRAALLAALLIGTAPFATAAFAKTAPVAAGPTLKVNDKVRAAQDAAVKALNAASALVQGGQVTAANQAAVLQALALAEAPVAAAEAAAQTPDELYVAQRLRYEKESRTNAARYYNDSNAAAQASVAFAPYLDKLLANPSTPPSAIAGYAYERGEISTVARQPDKALVFFERSKAAGNTDILNDARIVEAKIQLQDFAGAAAGADPLVTQLKARGITPPESYYLVAIEQSYRAKNGPLAASWETRHLGDYPSPKNWHDALVRLQTRGATLDLRQRLDVWRLMRAAKALPDEKERRLYAQDALEAGSSREAVALIQEIGATQPDTKAMLATAQTRVNSATPLAKIEADARAATTAQSALTAGNFNLSAGNYAKATEMYQLAQTRSPTDADALNTSLGIAQALGGDKASAKTSFGAVTGSPRKEIAAYWLAWIAQP